MRLEVSGMIQTGKRKPQSRVWATRLAEGAPTLHNTEGLAPGRPREKGAS